jgi:hypothetical protein
MDVTPSQAGYVEPLPIQAMAPVGMQLVAPVAMQTVAAAPTAGSAPVANMNEAPLAAGRGEVQDRADGVMQQLKWIEKLVFVAIFLALYAIMKK